MSESPAGTKRNSVLCCRELCVRRGRRLALDGVNFTLQPGECVSIIGPNGSGKTTLMLALLGLLPPAAGSVRLDDVEMRHIPARARGRYAAYVPQGLGPAPAFTIAEVVAGGRFPHVEELCRLSAADREIVDRALGLCGLAALKHRTFNTLSGGERQKTLIAAAIAQDPTALFLDEPNNALDPAYQIELVQILKSWCTPARSALLISHDLQLPQVLGGRVVALRGGRIAAEGPAAEILSPATLQAIYDAPFQVATTDAGVRFVVPAW
jgi:iron complex transport system ATP-binding protein